MGKLVLKALIFVVVVVFVMSVAGCEEQNQAVTKEHRLIAAENVELKGQLEQRDKEIEEQKELLERCLAEKKVLEEEADEKLEAFIGSLLEDLGDNVKLHEENKKLKSQIEALQKESSSLKAEIKQLKEEVEELQKETASTAEPL